MSLETLLLLQQVLYAQVLDGSAPDFDEVAPKVLVARRELAEAIIAFQTSKEHAH